MEKYYRILPIKKLHEWKGFYYDWKTCQMDNIWEPWPFLKYKCHYRNLSKRLNNYYHWFTEDWFLNYVNKDFDQTIAILTTNQEPFFYDHMQAMFQYTGFEKIDKIITIHISNIK